MMTEPWSLRFIFPTSEDDDGLNNKKKSLRLDVSITDVMGETGNVLVKHVENSMQIGNLDIRVDASTSPMPSDDENEVTENNEYHELEARKNVEEEVLSNVAEVLNDAVDDLNDSLEVEEVGGDILMNEEPIEENDEEPETNKKRKPRGIH